MFEVEVRKMYGLDYEVVEVWEFPSFTEARRWMRSFNDFSYEGRTTDGRVFAEGPWPVI